MSAQNSKPHMDRKIFSLGLSVNTVSLYLLMTGLADSGTDLTRDAMIQLFNGSQDEFETGLAELVVKGIIIKGDEGVYQVESGENWR